MVKLVVSGFGFVIADVDTRAGKIALDTVGARLLAIAL